MEDSSDFAGGALELDVIMYIQHTVHCFVILLLLAMCYGIHKHEMHSDAIMEEADGAHNEAKMRKAFGLC